MYLPTTHDESLALGWDTLDIILVSGDSFVDHPSVGVAVIGNILVDAGYRVGLIAQPDWRRTEDIQRLGAPRLFWGVTGGSVDSLVANRTALGKRRKRDDFSPGGVPGQRPDRAVIVYSNLIRQVFGAAATIVLGGIEASLRRISHYDFWNNRVRRSILVDARADFLLYGMADDSILAFASAVANEQSPRSIRGVCYLSRDPDVDCIRLPDHATVAEDPEAFTQAFHEWYGQMDAVTAKAICQRQDTRFLVQNPPAVPLTAPALDRIHELPYERGHHPFYEASGSLRALETIRFSISAHRGCYGECRFCAIAMHQGRTVQSRTPASILREAKHLTGLKGFHGRISDVGGPTANMYGFECTRKGKKGACEDRSCLSPTICPTLGIDHRPLTRLLERLRSVAGIKQVVVASGLRHDMVLADTKHGDAFLKQLVRHHVSGQLKVAPEHSDESILELMGKPNFRNTILFRKRFFELTRQAGKDQYLTYYFIAAYPGSRLTHMRSLAAVAREQLGLCPEQVQVFTPTPSTYASVMYYTGKNPFTGERLFVERDGNARHRQARVVTENAKRPKMPRANSRPGRKPQRRTRYPKKARRS